MLSIGSLETQTDDCATRRRASFSSISQVDYAKASRADAFAFCLLQLGWPLLGRDGLHYVAPQVSATSVRVGSLRSVDLASIALTTTYPGREDHRKEII